MGFDTIEINLVKEQIHFWLQVTLELQVTLVLQVNLHLQVNLDYPCNLKNDGWYQMTKSSLDRRSS